MTGFVALVVVGAILLTLYLKGQSYRDISTALEKNTKAIDNALARIKEKGRMLQLQVVFS